MSALRAVGLWTSDALLVMGANAAVVAMDASSAAAAIFMMVVDASRY